jgi:PAS domain S-box-containing protein
MNFTPELLIVDDRVENLELLRALLGKMDLKLDLIQSPIKALQCVEQKEYALIILDIQMPQMDGFLLAEKIRENSLNKDTPIVFLTAFYLDKESELKGYRCGCVDFMMKPFESSILINKVNIFLELYNNRKALEAKNDNLKIALRDKELLENRLRNLATDYRTILEGQSELIIKIDRQFNVEFANKAFSDFFDFSLDGVGQNSLVEINVELDAHIRSAIKEMNGKRSAFIVEKPLSQKKSQEKWIEWSISKILVLDEVHYMIVGRDISDKRHLKESLIKKEKIIQQTESTAQVGSFEWDSYSRIVRGSEQFKKIFEISSEAIGLSLEEIENRTHPDDLPDLKRLFSNFPPKNQAFSFQHRIIDGNSNVKFLKVDLCVEYNKKNNVFNIHGVVCDISTEKSLEMKFKEGLGQEKEVYQNKVFFELNKLFEISYLNQYGCDFLECDQLSEINGVNLLDFFSGEDKRRISSALDFESSHKEFAFEIVNLITRNNSNKKIVLAAHSNKSNGKPGIRGILLEISKSEHVDRNEVVNETITTLRRHEKEIVQNNLELKAKIEKELRINEFQRQLLLKKSELESLGKMASSVVHEINQPLTGISMIVDNILLRLSMKKIDEQYIREKCGQVFKDIDRIKSYLSQVGIFNSAQKENECDSIDVNNVVKNACDLVQKQYRNSGIEIKLDINPNALYVCGNKYKLQKVLVDILNNSYESIGEKLEKSKGIHEDEWIKVKTGLVKDEVIIEIKDNGDGIDPNNLNYIFEPFFSTKKLGVGSGLGLYISKDIIQKMNGKIAVKSKKNKYTEMKLILPFEIQGNGSEMSIVNH